MNRRAIREQSERNRAERVEREAREREAREGGRRAALTEEATPSPRAREDLMRHAELGARRRESAEERVNARNASALRAGFGEVPKYLEKRKLTLLRELNERMERALEDIERRREEREREREREREVREERRREVEARREALARRAAMDAARLSPRERAEARANLERARALFARAKIRVDDETLPFNVL